MTRPTCWASGRPAGPAEAQAAVGRGRRCCRSLARGPAAARAKALSDAAAALEQRSEEITGLVVREVGKPLSEARGEVARGVAILRYYAQAALLPDGETIPAAAADQLLMARHVPVGVAALITPWNFPGRHPAVEGRAEPGLRQRHDTEARERGGRDRTCAAGHSRRVPARRMFSRLFSAVRRRPAR